MHPVRKQRLILVSLMVVLSSAAIGLVTFALRDNINLFYPPADVVAGKAPTDRSIRLGGMVVEGSIERSETDLDTTFWVTDYEASVPLAPMPRSRSPKTWYRDPFHSARCFPQPPCHPAGYSDPLVLYPPRRRRVDRRD